MRGVAIALTTPWLTMAPVASVRAAISCADLETTKAARLVNAVQWNSIFGLILPGLGCQQTEKNSCEFQNTLLTDKHLGAGRRLIVVNANHLSGSGAYEVLTVFACKQSHVVAVLTGTFGYGIKVDYADRSSIVFTAGLWGSADAQCCPSKEQRFHYVWDAGSLSYQLRSREIFPTRR